MHDDELNRRERVSELADGRLEGEQLAEVVSWLSSSQDARTAWHSYHVVGDVLRFADLGDCSRDQAFVLRLRERLARSQQPDAAVPGNAALQAPPVAELSVVAAENGLHSANDAVVRWKWLTAAASLMAVAVLGWHLGSINTVASIRLAGAPAVGGAVMAGTAIAEANPPVMLRDPRLDELLAAHRQFGGTSALQMPAGFLRNATFEPPAR
jgi:sigma-E factor negative regulatory protein RseA